jgi:hypothetical protein
MFAFASYIGNENVEIKPSVKTIIRLVSKEYNIDHNLVSAVFYVESKHKVNAANKRTKDFGIAQINIRNIKRLGLSKEKLLNDTYYSVEQGVKILVWFKNKYEPELGNNWVGKYNCGVRKGCEKSKRSKKYIAKIYALL